jgi:hypothetical protein
MQTLDGSADGHREVYMLDLVELLHIFITRVDGIDEIPSISGGIENDANPETNDVLWLKSNAAKNGFDAFANME